MVKSLIAAFLLVLILLGGWGYNSYNDYRSGLTDYNKLADQITQPTVVGFCLQTLGIAQVHPSPGRMGPESPVTLGQSRVELGAIFALAITLVFAVTKMPGVIFSVSSTTFVSFFSLAAHMSVGLVLVGIEVWQGAMNRYFRFDFSVYSRLLFAAVLIGFAVVGMKKSAGLARGEQLPMKWVVAMLSILFLIVSPTIGLWSDQSMQVISKGYPFGGMPLAQIGILPNFAVAGYPCEFGLLALSFLSILMIALTRENYRYD